MDYRIYHAVNEFAVDDRWFAHAASYFESAGVVLYAFAVLVLWLATVPGEERRWKLAAPIAAGRILIGAHYPSDVLASLAISVVAAYLIVRFARPLLERGVLLLERISDPVVAPFHSWWQRRSLPTPQP